MDIRPHAPHLPLKPCGRGRFTGSVAVPDMWIHPREADCRKDYLRK